MNMFIIYLMNRKRQLLSLSNESLPPTIDIQSKLYNLLSDLSSKEFLLSSLSYIAGISNEYSLFSAWRSAQA